MLGSHLDIMSPQWTNVVFKDRNQAYGSYTLRRENPRTTNRALMIATSAFILILALPTIINKIQGFIPAKEPVVIIHEVDLKTPPTIEKQRVEPPVLPQKQVRSQHDMVRFPPPVVTPNETTVEPPTDKMLIEATPGQENMKGNKDADIRIDEAVGPVDRAGVTEEPDNKIIFTAVEINPMYPGGEAAFGKFLHDHIRYPSVAKENGTQGRVFVTFVVETDGSLTNMKVLRDPGSGLGDEAVRVLKTSQHWSPGVQNGKNVRVQFTVPINFALAE